MKIGLVPFLNVAPFCALPFEITYAVPSRLNEMMRKGELDAAFCSSVEYFEGPYERIPGLGLAAHGPIRSVNLYLKGSLDGAKIRLDPKSSTANTLVKVLCQGRATFSDEGESFVLIGDEALKKQHIDGYKTIDLASWWFDETGLPFVFALFIKQKGFDSRELEAALHASHDAFGPKIGELAREHGLPKKVLIEYFDLCQYHLGPFEEKGLEYFHDCQRALCAHRP